MLDDDIRARRFDEADVRKALEAMSIAELITQFGDPVWITHRHQTNAHWDGAERPALASEDPATMQAIGRCAASRVMPPISLPTERSIHDGARCGWCEYPLDELLKACEWSQSQSRYVAAEMCVWHEHPHTRSGAQYVRVQRGGHYQSKKWEEWFARPRHEREAEVTHEMYGTSA